MLFETSTFHSSTTMDTKSNGELHCRSTEHVENTHGTRSYSNHARDMLDLFEVSNESEPLKNKYKLTHRQARSEDNWIDINRIDHQNQQDDFPAVMVEVQKRTTARQNEAAETTAAEQIKQLENMLKGACDERDIANEMCDKLENTATEERRSYADQLSNAKTEYEDLRLLYEQERDMNEDQLNLASSDWEVRTKETQQHCEDLQAEVDGERKKHAKMIENTRLECETSMALIVSQHEQDKAAMLENLRRGSETAEILEAENQKLIARIVAIEPELLAQLTIIKQRDASIESLEREIGVALAERNSISALCNDLKSRAEAEAERLTGEIDLAISDKRRLERTVSGLKDELERVTSSQQGIVNESALEEEIANLKAQNTRLDYENTELGMTIDGLDGELNTARCEVWEYTNDALLIENELARTREEHAIELDRLTTPSKYPLVIRVAAFINDKRPEVALIKMNPNTPFKSVLENLRHGHPRKVLKVEVTGRFVFESDTPDHVSHMILFLIDSGADVCSWASKMERPYSSSKRETSRKSC